MRPDVTQTRAGIRATRKPRGGGLAKHAEKRSRSMLFPAIAARRSRRCCGLQIYRVQIAPS